jgi:hypothetical protein
MKPTRYPCLKCSEKPGTINSLCLVCDEAWKIESTRFKRYIGHEPTPDDFWQWLRQEEEFNRRILLEYLKE